MSLIDLIDLKKEREKRSVCKWWHASRARVEAILPLSVGNPQKRKNFEFVVP